MSWIRTSKVLDPQPEIVQQKNLTYSFPLTPNALCTIANVATVSPTLKPTNDTLEWFPTLYDTLIYKWTKGINTYFVFSYEVHFGILETTVRRIA